MATTKARRERRKHMQKILREGFDSRPKYRVFEDDDSSKPPGAIAVIEGRAAKTNIVNKNRRYYSTEVFEKAIGKAQSRLAEGSMVGELDHPDWEAALKTTAIKFDRLFLEKDENDPERPFVAFEGIIIDNEHGQQLLSLLEAGVRVGMSTRGSGKRRVGNACGQEDVTIIEDFELEGIDAVGNPSNAHGVIAHHEDDNGDDAGDHEPSEGDDSMDLKELKEKHPELLVSIQELTAKSLKDAHTEAVTALKEEHETAMSGLQTKFDEMDKKFTTLTEKVTASEKTDSEKETQAKIDEAVKESTEKAEAAEKKNKELEEKLNKATESDRKAARALAITEAVKKDEVADYAVILRTQLEAVKEDAEMTDAVVESARAAAENIWKSMGSPEGVGRLPKDGGRNGSQNNEDKGGKGGDSQVAENCDVLAALAGM